MVTYVKPHTSCGGQLNKKGGVEGGDGDLCQTTHQLWGSVKQEGRGGGGDGGRRVIRKGLEELEQNGVKVANVISEEL